MCASANPITSRLLLSGSMDQSVALYDVTANALVASWKQHTKYVVRYALMRDTLRI